MYNTKYECRYHKNDIFLDTDQVNDLEKEYVRNILYREDLINIFNIDIIDDCEMLNKRLSDLYERVKNNEKIKLYMKKIASTLLTEDEEIGLCLLYSYDYMFITHKCVSEYLENGVISDENIDILNKYVNN